MNQHFSEDELEGLLELAGKSNGKITFENFKKLMLAGIEKARKEGKL